MILNRVLLSLVSSGLLLSSVAIAAPDASSVAVIDANKVIQESKYAEKLKSAHESFTKKADALGKDFKALQAEYDAYKKKSTTLGKKDQQAQEKALTAKQNTLRSKEMELQKEFLAQRDSLMKVAMEKVRLSVSKIAERNQYTLVVNKTESWYNTDKIDITSQVAKDIK
ncbi:MAG TPA: OmpH family outer membrane protein [Gammaproteobacteria bacterium]|nr:OmpH family outer membrane protein [Gammaproteobacteria bacterium]